MLPKIDQPLFELTVPSTKKKITFRPFTVKEEKLLLIARESDEQLEMIRAMIQIVNNCVVEENFNVETLATFDLEYIFLKIRAVSIDNIIKVAYRDNEDQEIYKFEINLEDVEVKMSEDINNTIRLGEDSGVVLKYPPASMVSKAPTEFEDGTELMLFFVISCIDYIYQADATYVASEYEYEELKQFVETLPSKAFREIQQYFENTPKLYHKLTYKNNLGNDREIIMDSIKDFFPWR